MNKKLSRYGNSLALIIDKPILELLHIKEDTILHIETDGTKLIITPKAEVNKKMKIKDPKLQELLDKALVEYAEAFKKLADN